MKDGEFRIHASGIEMLLTAGLTLDEVGIYLRMASSVDARGEVELSSSAYASTFNRHQQAVSRSIQRLKAKGMIHQVGYRTYRVPPCILYRGHWRRLVKEQTKWLKVNNKEFHDQVRETLKKRYLKPTSGRKKAVPLLPSPALPHPGEPRADGAEEGGRPVLPLRVQPY